MSAEYDLTVAYVGNFTQSHCTEVHVADALERLGCTVIQLQENGLTVDEIERHSSDADLFLYTRTWGFVGAYEQAIAMMRRIERRGVITASFHLDLYLGLARANTLNGDPFWATEWVFTPDGDPASQAEFDRRSIKHVWSPPAVHGPECVPGRVVAAFEHDVVFTGSYPYPHPEWKYRDQLVEWCSRTYGPRFKRYGGGSTVIRNSPLNDLYRSAGVVVGDSLCPGFVKPGYWCVDAATEALTTDGWKSHDRLTEGDLIYTINPGSMLGEWLPALAVNRFDAVDCEMLSVEGASHSSLSTMNHRWLTERIVKGRIVREMRTSSQLGRFDRVPLSAPAAALPTTPKHSDALVELAAWAWTEGGVRGDRYASITQSHRSNPAYVARIRAALVELVGAPTAGALSAERHHGQPAWSEVQSTSRGMTDFRLNRAASDLLWAVAPAHRPDPRFIAALTASQLRLFVETSVDADGCRKGTAVTFAQKDATRLDGLEMACALLGIATNRVMSDDGCWIMQLKRRTTVGPVRPDARARRVRHVSHTGTVWCPTTGNGTWLARRNGSVYFTGNSDRLTETLGRGGVLVWPNIARVDEIGFEAGLDGHYLAYTFGDFEELHNNIEFLLDHRDEARVMADRAQSYVAGHHTYRERMIAMLDQMGFDE